MCNPHIVQPPQCTTPTVYNLHSVQPPQCTAYAVYNPHIVQPSQCTIHSRYTACTLVVQCTYTPSRCTPVEAGNIWLVSSFLLSWNYFNFYAPQIASPAGATLFSSMLCIPTFVYSFGLNVPGYLTFLHSIMSKMTWFITRCIFTIGCSVTLYSPVWASDRHQSTLLTHCPATGGPQGAVDMFHVLHGAQPLIKR